MALTGGVKGIPDLYSPDYQRPSGAGKLFCQP